MTQPREAIYAALFALLAGAASFATSSRRFRLWADVAAADQPALFLRVTSEEASTEFPGLPKRWKLSCEVYVYWRSDGADDAIADQAGNALRDALQAALDPVPGERQTLGGLVYDCRIDGKTVIDDGALDQQALAVIPITILTT